MSIANTYPPSNQSRIFLIRHGETAWALTGQHTGRTDIPLTTHGEVEAHNLGRLLATISFSQILCSPLKRAQQTCAACISGKSPVIIPELAEWDYGEYEGRRSADILQQRPNWNIYRDGCPGGESPEQISTRADNLIMRLHESEGNIALFTHGQIGSAIGARWINLPLVEAQHLSLSTASLSILSFDAHHPGVPVIALWNATASTSPRESLTGN